MIFHNPIFEKHIVLDVRSRKIPALLLICNIIPGIPGLLLFSTGAKVYNEGKFLDLEIVIAIYAVILVIAFVVSFFLVPALTAGSIAGERERQTLDLLFASGLSAGQIVVGNYMKVMHTVFLFLLSGSPVLCLIFAVGGITPGQVMMTLFWFMVCAGVFCAIGIFFSAVCRRMATAVAGAYGGVLLYTAGTFILAWVWILIMDKGHISTLFSWPVVIMFLLVSPVFNGGILLWEQIGATGAWMNISDYFLPGGSDILYSILDRHWVLYSMAAQIILIAVLLHASARKLDPMKKGYHKKFK